MACQTVIKKVGNRIVYKKIKEGKTMKYKRLTERLMGSNAPFTEYASDNEVLQRLAELEDKIENGTLIELPCKVGTTVYQIYKDCSNCLHFKETGWEYDCWCDFDSEESKTMFEFDGDNDCVYIIEETEFTYNHIKDFGKDLFLTKAEAEAKLKELKEV